MHYRGQPCVGFVRSTVVPFCRSHGTPVDGRKTASCDGGAQAVLKRLVPAGRLRSGGVHDDFRRVTMLLPAHPCLESP